MSECEVGVCTRSVGRAVAPCRRRPGGSAAIKPSITLVRAEHVLSIVSKMNIGNLFSTWSDIIPPLSRSSSIIFATQTTTLSLRGRPGLTRSYRWSRRWKKRIQALWNFHHAINSPCLPSSTGPASPKRASSEEKIQSGQRATTDVREMSDLGLYRPHCSSSFCCCSRPAAGPASASGVYSFPGRPSQGRGGFSPLRDSFHGSLLSHVLVWKLECIVIG